MPSTSVSREIEVDRLSAQLWLPRRALMAWDAGSGRGTHGRDQAVGGRALHRAATSDQAHGRPLDHRRSPPALHQRRPAARNHLACRRPPPAALDRYLVHLPSYARRMPRCTRSACAGRMRPTPERARCAAPDSYARRLSAFRWQDAACMERRCRLSAVQAEQVRADCQARRAQALRDHHQRDLRLRRHRRRLRRAVNAFQATRTDDGTVKSEKLYCEQAPGFNVKAKDGAPMVCEIPVALQVC